MPTLVRSSPAKINLTLRVVGLRPDGFHELESLVALVDLADTVSITPDDAGRLSLECDDPALPVDDRNLAMTAARALAAAAGASQGARIRLAKRIPAGAGLGGGSSNAATTLKLLNELWDCRLTIAELHEIAARVGSDVPLFLHGPVCVLRGRGERIDHIRWRPPCCHVGLVLPPLHCSTPAVYAAWDRMTLHLPRRGLDALLADLDRSAGAAGVMECLFNDLEQPAFAVCPELADIARRVGAAVGPVRLTGSGSALYRLMDSPGETAAFAAAVGELGVPYHMGKLLVAPAG